MRLTRSVTAALAAATLLVATGCGSTSPPQGTHVSSALSRRCPHEQAVVRRALDRSPLRADVNGDGKPDTVAAASDPGARPPCRGFVAVRLAGGGTYARHLFRRAVPIKGLPARIIGLPHLGRHPGAAIVVDTRAAVDSVLAQMFAFSHGRLFRVAVPGFADGTFIVEGGGLVFPQGAGCTSDRRVLLSSAALTKDGKSYRVTRRSYPVQGPRLRFGPPARSRATVPARQLGTRFPEFTSPHWDRCGGSLR